MTESERLREWSADDLHLGQSVRHWKPTYPNPAALRKDMRDALDRLEAAARDLAQARQALQRIAYTAGWYADNGSRLPHEVDHALCVEILSEAEGALDALPAREALVERGTEQTDTGGEQGSPCAGESL